MTPEEFIDKWRASTLTERSAAQSHFNDLCAVLGVPTPAEADPHGDTYTFEKNVLKLDGRTGYADVWKKNCFAWEYKRDKKNLVAAYSQLKEYAGALENPPLLIVSDMKEIRVHTNFTNELVETTVVRIGDLYDPPMRRKLRLAFTEPERWRPAITHEGVTTRAAASFADIARKLQAQGHEPRQVAHFLNKLVFCLFVEDIGLLPDHVFSSIVEESLRKADDFAPMLETLFGAMREGNRRFGTTAVPWFNGGLFDDDVVLPLGWMEIKALADAARLDWSGIEPSIFGTLFERGLDPGKRKLMASLFDAAAAVPAPQPGLFADAPTDKGVGIHYTDTATIMKIIEPVVLRPLDAEWRAVKETVAAHREARDAATDERARVKAEQAARDAYLAFRAKLGTFRVLDPASGSGNFLYLALHHLKDFDLKVLKEAAALGLPLDGQRVGPQAVLGIEINPYAAELARVTIWIGELQWQMKNAAGITRAPILGRLDGIVCRDALLDPNGGEAKWPEADVIVGNPPFLGGKRLISQLGEDYVLRLFKTYAGRVPPEADLVCYWFDKAARELSQGRLRVFGLVSTNSIRGGANRKVLRKVLENNVIFDAWDDEPWVIDGANVRVSLVSCVNRRAVGESEVRWNGSIVVEIFSDLSARTGAVGVDLTKAERLAENANVAFMGDTKGGKFDVPGKVAREWLLAPVNPNGRTNADVLRFWMNGMDVTRRPRDMWIVDFGWSMSEEDAALYEVPFDHVLRTVKPEREKNRRENYRNFWWRHVEPRPGMHATLSKYHRFLATPRLAKHRVFVWFPRAICPDSQLIVVTRDDDTTFGILHSRFHELWSLRMGTSLEDRPRYTPSTTFETFPFPEGLTPDIPAAEYADDPRAQAIAEAAKRLNELREAWLNPPDLVKRVPEVVAGYPDRVLPVGDKAAEILRKRTLTNLYNARPAWLANAHRDLDAAVAEAYGWPADLADDEVLARLFALNQERAAGPSGRQKE